MSYSWEAPQAVVLQTCRNVYTSLRLSRLPQWNAGHGHQLTYELIMSFNSTGKSQYRSSASSDDGRPRFDTVQSRAACRFMVVCRKLRRRVLCRELHAPRTRQVGIPSACQTRPSLVGKRPSRVSSSLSPLIARLPPVPALVS